MRALISFLRLPNILLMNKPSEFFDIAVSRYGWDILRPRRWNVFLSRYGYFIVSTVPKISFSYLLIPVWQIFAEISEFLNARMLHSCEAVRFLAHQGVGIYLTMLIDSWKSSMFVIVLCAAEDLYDFVLHTSGRNILRHCRPCIEGFNKYTVLWTIMPSICWDANCAVLDMEE